MGEVSSRDLRNNTAQVLRRVEAGETLVVTVNHRPVAELGPKRRPRWISGATLERILREGPADPGLLDDLRVIRGQRIEDPWRR